MDERWATSPFLLIETPAFTKDRANKVVMVATEMTLAHNSFFRALNSIYLQACGVKNTTDIADFLIYCQAWFEMVTHHHDTEEKIFFPRIMAYTRDSRIMQGNIDGHKAFHAGLEKFGKYAYETVPDGFDGNALKQIVDDFAEPFSKHMREEIQSLLGLEKHGGDDLFDAYSELDARIIATSDKHRLFPLVLGSSDSTFENAMHSWPPVPFFVPYIVHYYYERKHRGAWRFSPCDTFGKPRKLEFLSS